MSDAAAFVSTKTFSNFPCAHRQWRHDGDCALIHGYSRSFHFQFGAHTLDACGFAVDFGKLDFVKAHLEYMFDHTMLINPDDPYLDKFKELDELGICALRVMPYGVGMEATAMYLCEFVDERLREITNGRCWVISVEARENDKNSAVYANPEAGFKGWK